MLAFSFVKENAIKLSHAHDQGS